MKRYIPVAAALGFLNAVVVLVVMLLIREAEQALQPEYTYGFFSYSPLTEYQPPSRFPWEYVLPPLVLAVLNGSVAALLLHRRDRTA